MKFIDLFAGLGGFHVALRSLGHTCVFASEYDESLRQLYAKNFGLMPEGDIRKIHIKEIPRHNILCAGFPCQPFSKAGEQQGLSCPKWGDLFDYVIKILRYHQPKYFILENVPNLSRHDSGETWDKMKRRLKSVGYSIDDQRLSPHQFGIPQVRERIFIVGNLSGLNGFSWPEVKRYGSISIVNMLEKSPVDARHLSPKVIECLNVWQEFIRRFPKVKELPSFPIWSMEFGATYPYKRTTPTATLTDTLRRYRGSHGRPLSEGKTREEVFKLLPSHAGTNQPRFPEWKVRFVERNRTFYERHKAWLDDWMEKIKEFPSSFQKLEWNCQERDPRGEDRRLGQYVIQIRPSGVRVKRPTTAPSLVAMTATQVPIVTWESRYMTPTECKRLQSMEELRYLPDTPTKAYEALGNAVNVRVAQLVAEALVGHVNSMGETAEKSVEAEPVPAYKSPVGSR